MKKLFVSVEYDTVNTHCYTSFIHISTHGFMLDDPKYDLLQNVSKLSKIY